MQGKHYYDQQTDLFKIELKTFLSEKIALYRLTDKINWEEVHSFYGPYYSCFGRPSVPTRTMVGLLLLKSMLNVPDEVLIPTWIQNPYWQYFCGEQCLRDTPPCDPSDLVHFRKRIGKKGSDYLLKLTFQLHSPEEYGQEQILLEPPCKKKTLLSLPMQNYTTLY
ncbi:MAG: transposase [Bacteroidetes bacterium]|nr:transposase [Bacteroidota bacterium]